MKPITQHGYVSMQQAIRDLIQGIINFRAGQPGGVPSGVYLLRCSDFRCPNGTGNRLNFKFNK